MTHDDDGAPDRPLSEDTGRISTRFHSQLASDAGVTPAVTPPFGTATADQFLDKIAEKLAVRVNGNEGGGHRRFLGLEAGGWTKLLISMLLAGAVALAAWWLTVRDELAKRTTAPDVETRIERAAGHHARDADAHPPIQKRLDAIDGEQRTIRESQIRQEETTHAQTRTLRTIAEDVKQLRRRRGR